MIKLLSVNGSKLTVPSVQYPFGIMAKAIVNRFIPDINTNNNTDKEQRK